MPYYDFRSCKCFYPDNRVLFVFFFLEECGTSSIAFKILKRSDYKGKFATFGLKLADKRLALKLLLTLTLTYRLRVTLSHLR